RMVDSIKRYAKICHDHGALAFTSFNHMGVYIHDFSKPSPIREMMQNAAPFKADGTQYQLPTKAYGPSKLVINEPWDGITSQKLTMDDCNGRHVYEMTENMMNEIADAFAHCALVAKNCDLDGVVIHSGHGFLFSQLISRRFNKRTDKYGGSMENRARFPIMCLKRIREAVGDDFLIEMRFSAEEDISPITSKQFIKDVVTIDETVEFFKELDKYPGLLDIAHITGGLHTVPIYNTRVVANSFFPMGVNVRGAAAVKAAVKNIKVGVVGSLSDPALCEEIIATGKADFVILCRQLLMADPEFPNKAKSGRDELIDNCLRCTICHNNDHCAVNPANILMGQDDPLYIKKSKDPKKVVIVGGGIAGMKAAEYAHQAGHKVVLFEKSDRLGGILRYSDNDPFKSDIRRFRDSMIKRLESMDNVDIRLRTEATPELVKAEAPDAVLVATGGKPLALQVPGGDKENVLDAVTAYLEPERVGERIAVVGGGLTGCEAAIFWAHRGKKVALISRSKELMRKVVPRRPANGSADTHLVWLHTLPIDIFKGFACERITQDGLYARGNEGEVFIMVDTVINATGMTHDAEGASAFNGTADFVRAIGDCVNAASIGDAVLAARRAVIEMG
ncbi:MAG: FAD-dependent oxidoreductase, partial [Oscillospiraceae bacterium]